MPSAHDPPPEQAAYLHRPDTEPIAGYRLLEPLGRGGFGEVWKCEAPGGLLKAIKFVQGGMHPLDDALSADEELRAIQRIKGVRHPFILSMERVEVVAGELIIVLELADRNLADVLHDEQSAGRIGIARRTLLGRLREAAEALDVLHVQYQLQHLDIKPQNLFLVANHVKVGDFGLVQSLASGDGGKSGRPLAITPRYAAPEVFGGVIGPNADQYSLAIVYQELLTSTFPFDGKNYRQLCFQHTQAAPDLCSLPEADQPVIARALAKDPAQRFPSCSDFVHALYFGQTEIVTTRVPGKSGQWLRPRLTAQDTVRPHDTRTMPVPGAGPPDLQEMPTMPLPPAGITESALGLDLGEPGYRFGASLPSDVVRMRLDGFRRQWNADTILADADRLVLHMKAPRSFWQRWTVREPRLEVCLSVLAETPPAPGAPVGTEVCLHIAPLDCPAGQSEGLLGVVGPLLAESVRTHLLLNPHQRGQERLVWRHPLRLCAVQPDETLGPPIECQGKDISLNGIGFYLQGEVPSPDIMLYLPETPMTTQAYVRARIVRASPCGDNWHEVGAVLDVPCELADTLEKIELSSEPPVDLSALEAPAAAVPAPAFPLRPMDLAVGLLSLTLQRYIVLEGGQGSSK